MCFAQLVYPQFATCPPSPFSLPYPPTLSWCCLLLFFFLFLFLFLPLHLPIDFSFFCLTNSGSGDYTPVWTPYQGSSLSFSWRLSDANSSSPTCGIMPNSSIYPLILSDLSLQKTHSYANLWKC